MLTEEALKCTNVLVIVDVQIITQTSNNTAFIINLNPLDALYPASPRQLLQSDTGVPHFALDLLTHRSSPKSLTLLSYFLWKVMRCVTFALLFKYEQGLIVCF